MKKGKGITMYGCLICAVTTLFTLTAAAAPQRENTFNEVRDAFISLEGTMRSYGDKLERHEGRERQLGETLRRALAAIEKRVALLQRNSEDRARELERFLIQAEERERIQLQKAAQSVESLGSVLEARLGRIEALVQANTGNNGREMPVEIPCLQSLAPKLELLDQRLGTLEEIVDNGTKELTRSTANINKFEEGLNQNLVKSANILEYLISTDSNKEKETEKPSNMAANEEIKDLMIRVTESLNSLSLQAAEAHNDAVRAMRQTVNTLGQLEQEIKTDSQRQVDILMQKFNEVQNTTLSAVERVTMGLEANAAKGKETNDIENALADDFRAVKEEIKVLTQLTEASRNDLKNDIWYFGNQSGIATSDTREAILKKINDAIALLSPEPLLKTLTDMEHVMLQAADGVMDVGRRVEYSAGRVIGELGDEIKSTSSLIESKISSRLDNLAASVLVNQTGAMETLSQKVESEISQVWRQIGIMYQQLTQSVGMLDKLQVQTENYVNGSLKSMGSVEGRVGEIGERVGEVEGNLNFLLGRLSLVATEFNHVKRGLAEALDDVRKNMASVNNDIRAAPPGTEYDHINQVSPIQGQ